MCLTPSMLYILYNILCVCVYIHNIKFISCLNIIYIYICIYAYLYIIYMYTCNFFQYYSIANSAQDFFLLALCSGAFLSVFGEPYVVPGIKSKVYKNYLTNCTISFSAPFSLYSERSNVAYICNYILELHYWIINVGYIEVISAYNILYLNLCKFCYLNFYILVYLP